MCRDRRLRFSRRTQISRHRAQPPAHPSSHVAALTSEGLLLYEVGNHAHEFRVRVVRVDRLPRESHPTCHPFGQPPDCVHEVAVPRARQHSHAFVRALGLESQRAISQVVVSLELFGPYEQRRDLDPPLVRLERQIDVHLQLAQCDVPPPINQHGGAKFPFLVCGRRQACCSRAK
eukprot:CAMPEP_0205947006 /NCGR_PEP_ID=MMETSP1325-20131115/69342_1 /ASSEMBLY_ACC=CAM_ASM_000708 /TAXON_ID=236786 /ORGANISM="Florenciella sp., Strain RCC1007" /LENGTH=174 /DNA_ID=CAMNT_0053318103 /DNA_START=248 /DNA_END=773 /DNA_ORIENTATION=+